MTRWQIFTAVLSFLLGAVMSGCVADIPPTPAATATPTGVPTPDHVAEYATWQADPCRPPSDMRVDGQVTATLFIWLDYNGNGKVDDGEPPLRDISYWGGTTESRTGPDGMGSYYEFKPGCPCHCWEGVKISVEAPEGFEATTPLSHDLQGPAELLRFGLRVRLVRTEFPGEPDWYTEFYDHSLQLTDFHYNGYGRIDATFSQIGLNDDQFYAAIFDTLAILVTDHTLPIAQLNIVNTRSAEAQQCDVARILADRPDKSVAYLVQTYCKNS